MLVSKEKSVNFQRKSIVWINFLVLDLDLHKTSRVEILTHLAKRGYDVYLMAVESKKRHCLKNSSIHAISIPLRYVPIISPILFGLIVLFFLPFYVIRKRPDFVVVEHPIATFFVWKPLLSQFVKFKVILDIRSPPATTWGFRGYLKMLGFSISVYTAKLMFDGITIITSAMKKEVCKKFNIPPKSVGTWSDGASIELFTYEKNISYGSELRKKFGLLNKFIILYHGALGGTRGIAESVEAMGTIKKRYGDMFLFLLGNSPNINKLENLIQKNDVQDNVIVHGPVDYKDVPKYIAMSDVGIVPLPNHPAWRNQCPLKLLEYLAMKRTVILTDIPANREIVREKKCGIYVSSCDPIRIAKAMEFAYNNRDKLKQWGELGRTIIEEKYNWDKAAKDLETYLLKAKRRFAKW